MIKTTHLFPVLHSRLIDLLDSLEPADWQVATAVPGRSMKDLVAHILHSSIRRLSDTRDGYRYRFKGEAPTSLEEVVTFIQTSNQEWIRAFRCVSPSFLKQLLELIEPQLWDYFANLDPHAKAAYPVAWAGETESENWFDIAREYTEKWHHQAQIRDATGRHGIREPELYEPLLDTLALGLPHAFRELGAPEKSIVKVELTGLFQRRYVLCYEKEGWQMVEQSDSSVKPITSLKLENECAWRLWTNSGDRLELGERISVIGDKRFLPALQSMITVMAPITGAPAP